MKRFSLLVIPLLLAACSEEKSEPTQSRSQYWDLFDDLTETEQAIVVNILSTKYDGFKKGEIPLNVMSDIKLQPYIEDKDTLFYIAKYKNGNWQLYSANSSIRMLLAESPMDNNFKIQDSDSHPSIKICIEDYIDNIKYITRNNIQTVDSSWGYLGLTDQDFKESDLFVTEDGISRKISYQDIPKGQWDLIEAEPMYVAITWSNKLVKTKWHQWSPLNLYADEVLEASNNTYVKAPSGSVPVTVAQYEYYTHYREDIPVETADTAYLNDDGHTFSFSGSSQNIWKKMDLYPESDKGDEAAILVGHIGKELHADYRYDGTSVKINNLINYLDSIYNTQFVQEDFDFSYIKNSIDNFYPVIALSSSLYNTDNTDLYSFLIDGYNILTKEIRYVFGLRRDTDSIGFDDSYIKDVTDNSGNIINYAYTCEIVLRHTEPFITMNWGYEWLKNHIYWAFLPDNIFTGEDNFPIKHFRILKRQDIQL